MGKIKEALKSFKIKTRKKDLLLLFLFFGFALIIPFGAMNKFSRFEFVGNYASSLIKQNTNNSDYCSLIVEPNEYTEDSPLLDTRDEFINLYGAFGESNINYVGAVNAKKDHAIYLNEYSTTENLSFIYVEKAGFSNVEYDGAYKHQYYPLQLMFSGNHSYSDAFSFCYISQTQADVILETKNMNNPYEKYTYYDLVNNQDFITINMDGIDYEWRIGNIYYEKNSFYEAISDVMGSFLLGYNRYPPNFKKESVYFLKTHTFQNTYLINYAVNNYSPNMFDYSIGTFNLINKNISQDLKLSVPVAMNCVSYFGFVISVFALAYFVIAIYKTKYFFERKRMFFIITIPLVPFTIFQTIRLLSNNPFFFSGITSIVFGSCLILFYLTLIVYFLIFYFKYKKDASK